MLIGVTVEETRNKDIEVEAEDFDEACEIVEEMYSNGQIDMRCGAWVTVSVGDAFHDFQEIAQWGC